MIVRRFASLPFAAALLFAPTLARAQQGCSELRAQYADIDAHGTALVNANTGISVVALACIATAANNYDKTHDVSASVGTFAVCGGLGCNFVTGGYANCLSVGSDIIFSALRLKIIQNQMRQDGC